MQCRMLLVNSETIGDLNDLLNLPVPVLMCSYGFNTEIINSFHGSKQELVSRTSLEKKRAVRYSHRVSSDSVLANIKIRS